MSFTFRFYSIEEYEKKKHPSLMRIVEYVAMRRESMGDIL